MKKVYCSYHQLFGQCTEQDFKDASTGANPSRMVRVTFPTFTQAVPLHTLEEADWYVCTKHGTTWMGRMADMIDGYEYPEKGTHTNLTSMEAQKIMDTLTYHQHSYSCQ